MHHKEKESDDLPPAKGPQREHPSTYFVQDRSSQDELSRLQIQDQMLTASMGGVLSEQSNPMSFQSVLDVGCATGDWLIEVAKQYPMIKRLVGVDISGKMLVYARAHAEAQGVSDRVEFHSMDALRMLEFPASTFDLVNQRYAMSWLRKWDWPKLMQEYDRVSTPRGMLRITECALLSESSSPASLALNRLLLQAFYQAGNFFTETHDGVISQLARLLDQHGWTKVQTRAYRLEYRVGTPQWQPFYEDSQLLFRTAKPFLRKWTHLPNDYEALVEQALKEIQEPDFVGIWHLLTVWGTKRRQ